MPDPHDPSSKSVGQLLQTIRDRNHVPIGMVSYDVEGDQFFIDVCTDVSGEEADVLLRKLNLCFKGFL